MNKTKKQTLLSSWLRVSKRDDSEAPHAAKRKLDEVEKGEHEAMMGINGRREEEKTDVVDGKTRPEREKEEKTRPEDEDEDEDAAARPMQTEAGKGDESTVDVDEKENHPTADVATAAAAAAEGEEEEGEGVVIRDRGEEKDKSGNKEEATETTTTAAAAAAAAAASAPSSQESDDELDADDDDDGLTAYERERERLIARNREALAALGVESAARALSSAAAAGNGGNKKQRRSSTSGCGAAAAAIAAARRAERAAASAALREEGAARRSSLRPRRGGQAVVGGGEASAAAGAVVAAAPRPRTPTPEPETYDNKIVLNYIIDRDDARAADVSARSGDKNDDDNDDDNDAPPSSLRRLPVVLAGPVVRAYSVSTSSCGSLLAAGGKDGWAAIWGIRGIKDEAVDVDDDTGDDVDDEGGGERAPLLSARLHRSWIADVALVSRREGGKVAPLLLTAANDGTLAIHDSGAAAEIEKKKKGGNNISSSSSSSAATAAGAPLRVADATPHGGAGIFSMAVLEEEDSSSSNHFDFATASKDGSVVVSRVLGDGRAKVQSLTAIDGAHGGAVAKCVRWRDANTLASCGNDGAARLWDVRCPFGGGGGGGGAASLEIAEATVGGVAANVVRWRRSRDQERNHLLVAGTNPEALVFDVRKPSSPMLKLKPPPPPSTSSGKTSSSSSVIYQPCYVGGKRHGAIAVGLPRSRVVSLFDADTGAPLSRGDVGGHDASTLQSLAARDGGEVVCAVGTRCLHLFEAV